jgi:hypothetical protein
LDSILVNLDRSRARHFSAWLPRFQRNPAAPSSSFERETHAPLRAVGGLFLGAGSTLAKDHSTMH